MSGAIDEFLVNACLTYTDDGPDRWRRAERLWTDEMAESPYAAAAVGDPARVRAVGPGGPLNWEPLLYLAYSRAPQVDPVGAARALLDAGADPNAGWLWNGLPSPFTVLTGVFGEGEDAVNQPRHPAEAELAALLLERGADPNDNQALYNRMFGADDSHLRLLFAHGLGTAVPTPWRDRLGDAHRRPDEMLHDVLLWAAANSQPDRVRLLLDHGVAPVQPYPGHPVHRGRGAVELALLNGNPDIAELLVAAGAPRPGYPHRTRSSPPS